LRETLRFFHGSPLDAPDRRRATLDQQARRSPPLVELNHSRTSALQG
jgi:hypothetical protein